MLAASAAASLLLCLSVSLRTRRGENRPLPAYTDPSMRYVAIYDTGPDPVCFVREKTAPLQSPPCVDTRILSPIYLLTLFFVIFFRGRNPPLEPCPALGFDGLSERDERDNEFEIARLCRSMNGLPPRTDSILRERAWSSHSSVYNIRHLRFLRKVVSRNRSEKISIDGSCSRTCCLEDTDLETNYERCSPLSCLFARPSQLE